MNKKLLLILFSSFFLEAMVLAVPGNYQFLDKNGKVRNPSNFGDWAAYQEYLQRTVEQRQRQHRQQQVHAALVVTALPPRSGPVDEVDGILYGLPLVSQDPSRAFGGEAMVASLLRGDSSISPLPVGAIGEPNMPDRSGAPSRQGSQIQGLSDSGILREPIGHGSLRPGDNGNVG